MTRYLCLIPARGGSKGIPRKNIRPLAGKPLIAWTIGHARAAAALDRIVVSTDDQEIAEKATEFGAEVPFLRPTNLATDSSSTEAALLHAIETLDADGYWPDAIVTLQPTSPIRKSNAVARAIRRFEEMKADSLLSVCPLSPFIWRGADAAEALYDHKRRPRRQDIRPDQMYFQENGSIYITKTEVLLAEQNRLGGRIVLFQMSDEEGHDIDTESDFATAEAAIKHLEHTDDYRTKS